MFVDQLNFATYCINERRALKVKTTHLGDAMYRLRTTDLQHWLVHLRIAHRWGFELWIVLRWGWCFLLLTWRKRMLRTSWIKILKKCLVFDCLYEQRYFIIWRLVWYYWVMCKTCCFLLNRSQWLYYPLQMFCFCYVIWFRVIDSFLNCDVTLKNLEFSRTWLGI